MSGERQYDRCAYESYIRDLGQEDSTLRAAFRTAFFEAMRSELTARQYEVLRLETVEGMNGITNPEPVILKDEEYKEMISQLQKELGL